MKFDKTHLRGLYVAEIEPIIDDRGFFARVYCDEELKEVNINKPIKQANHSFASSVGSIRGMHYQNYPHAEAKMVRCISGEVYDVVVDIRKDSDTFLKWHGEYISAKNFKMMIIPEGFAHGFQVIKPNSELIYLHSESYNPKFESGLLYDDDKIGIEWPLQLSGISDKDLKHNKITKDFIGI